MNLTIVQKKTSRAPTKSLLSFSLIAVAFSLFTHDAHAGSQNGADYQCGPYRLGLKGPDHSALFDAQANLLGEWDEEGAEPTTFKNNTLYLNWNGKTYRCRPISSN